MPAGNRRRRYRKPPTFRNAERFDGRLPFDRTMKISISENLAKETITDRLPTNLKTLKMLKVFFGSSSCSAPTALDIFGTLNPTGRYGPAYIIELKKKFRSTKITGIPPNRFALAVSIRHQFSVAADLFLKFR